IVEPLQPVTDVEAVLVPRVAEVARRASEPRIADDLLKIPRGLDVVVHDGECRVEVVLKFAESVVVDLHLLAAGHGSSPGFVVVGCGAAGPRGGGRPAANADQPRMALARP